MKKMKKVLDFVQNRVYHHNMPRQWSLEIAWIRVSRLLLLFVENTKAESKRYKKML